MSFFKNPVTFTRYTLSPDPRWPPIPAVQGFPLKDEWVRVELLDRTSQPHMYAATVSAGLLYIYVPSVEDRLVWEPTTWQWTLPISVPSMEYAADIEIPALRWVFLQMHGIAFQHQNWNCIPKHESVGQGVLLYRALQLLRLNDAAQELRPRLMKELRTKALTAYDVQRMWWTFQFTGEWAEWLEALMVNLGHFKVYLGTPEGSYIRDFIETEMHQLKPEERAHIECLYREHRFSCQDKSYAVKVKGLFQWALGLVS